MSWGVRQFGLVQAYWSKCEHGATVNCASDWFFSPPAFKKKRHADRLWCHPPPLSPFPHLPPPQPTQACDVTVLDNEVRFLLLLSVRMTSILSGSQRPLLTATRSHWIHTALSGPPRMHFKVGDQGLTCAWHPENDNTSASLHLLLRASAGDTKAHRLLPRCPTAWRKHSFRRGGGFTLIQEEGRALCVFYMHTGG